MPYNGTSNENAAFSLIFERLENPACSLAIVSIQLKAYPLEALTEKNHRFRHVM